LALNSNIFGSIYPDTMTTYQAPQIRQGIDGIALAAFLLIGFGAIMVFRDISSSNEILDSGGGMVDSQFNPETVELNIIDSEVGSGQDAPQDLDLERRVSPPYEDYTLTQGPHGFSYGHMAIDISAGQGAIIKSPIQGYVADLYTDQYGNPTLVIENDFFRVTMLHGKYKVSIGDQIAWGQMLGRESNLGLTTDLQGRSCRNRACGYHTHLNIFDKQLGENVNPLKLMEQ
jgi:murein DD-endopeptidase MepM/ murein hydrolase activator NlpD